MTFLMVQGNTASVADELDHCIGNTAGSTVLDVDAIRTEVRDRLESLGKPPTIHDLGRIAGRSRQALDIWVRVGILRPSLRPPQRGPIPQLYSASDAFNAVIAARLTDRNISLEVVRKAVGLLRKQGLATMQQPQGGGR